MDRLWLEPRGSADVVGHSRLAAPVKIRATLRGARLVPLPFFVPSCSLSWANKPLTRHTHCHQWRHIRSRPDPSTRESLRTEKFPSTKTYRQYIYTDSLIMYTVKVYLPEGARWRSTFTFLLSSFSCDRLNRNVHFFLFKEGKKLHTHVQVKTMIKIEEEDCQAEDLNIQLSRNCCWRRRLRRWLCKCRTYI